MGEGHMSSLMLLVNASTSISPRGFESCRLMQTIFGEKTFQVLQLLTCSEPELRLGKSDSGAMTVVDGRVLLYPRPGTRRTLP